LSTRFNQPVLGAAVLVLVLIAAGGVRAYLSYVPMNGAFERYDDTGNPFNWTLASAPSGDGLKTTAALVDDSYKGSKALYLGSLGTGSASARIGMPIEFNALRMLYSGTAEFYYKVLSSGASGRNIAFRLDLLDEYGRTVAGAQFSPPSDHVGDGTWHRHAFKVDIRESRTAKYMALSFSINGGESKAPGAWIVDELQIFEAPAALRIGSIRCARAVVRVGETFSIGFNLSNQGGGFFHDLHSRIKLPAGLRAAGDAVEKILGVVEPGLGYEVSWNLVADRPGAYAVEISSFSPDDEAFSPEAMATAVGAAEFSHPESRADRARCSVTEKEIVLENPLLRLSFPATEAGYGLFALQCWDGFWRDMAVSMPLGHAVFVPTSGEKTLLLLTPQAYDCGLTATGAWLLLQGWVADDDGVTWAASYRFDLGDAAPHVNVSFSVQTSAKRKILRLSGPQILAGEGSFGANRDKGLFCGLEYLLPGERSSGTDFVYPPGNLRTVPDPLKVTIPLMAIDEANCSVALSWNPLEKWDGTNSMVSAKYLSPNWPQNQSNHVMALFIPTIPGWLKENEDEASTPYSLDRPVTIHCQLFAKSKADILGALAWWLGEHGVPSPPNKPRSFEDTIDLCTKCFKDICWVESAKAWRHTHLTDPSWIFWDTLVALPLWHQSALSTDLTLRSEIRAQVLEALAATGGWGVDMDLALHLGEVDKALASGYNYVQTLIDSQNEDGSWPYVASDQKHELLGRPGDTSSGWTASRARFLLKFGRITGDLKSIGAGLKALEYLDTQARPEGAQTWELQLHVPDVLASSYVMECYLEAYRITGKDHYLEKARFWALTGLPFIYLWNPADRPIMRYGSIPVFGATWFTGTWFGNIVQWNGLDYAYKLCDLSRYDESLPWRTIAEGITICGMQMQRYPGGPHSEVLGMYPDAYSAVKGDDAYYFDINPRFIALCIFGLMGYDETAQTEIVSVGDGRIHISTAGRIGNSSLQGGVLAFDVQYPAGDSSYAIVGGVSRPSAVAVNGMSLNQTQDLSKVSQGWTYRSDGVLVIRMLHATTDCVEVRGVRYQPSSRFAPEPVWEFDSEEAEGWMNTNMLMAFAVGNGTLATRSTGADPYMIGPSIQIQARTDDVVTIRMKLSAGQQAQIFWIRKSAGQYSESKSMVFTVNPDGQFHTYEVMVGQSPEWNGTITQIRLDPTNMADAAIYIDYVRIREDALLGSFALLAMALARRIVRG